ncbi:hypothetical protein KGQ19_15500 [Catenulispora sp. NL8]|uniref:Uncharacterized protein n=1 Tax=Catenulispora pinistramenti TaxID=2705254 RepID=A0ABS5KQF0_9ACTN|nr:hypothetical protein [Catenulispora pinistramenti]MBS2548270.1 hypothetical protein [Catenulispora pinistramenti]
MRGFAPMANAANRGMGVETPTLSVAVTGCLNTILAADEHRASCAERGANDRFRHSALSERTVLNEGWTFAPLEQRGAGLWDPTQSPSNDSDYSTPVATAALEMANRRIQP